MSEAPIIQSCTDLELELDSETMRKLLKIQRFLQFYGRAMNLTGAARIDSHIDEALHLVALARRLELSGRWLDVGSGGGFPALILAACLDHEFVLVEPRAKRASNLELALAKIGRRDIPVLRGRIDHGRWQAIEGGPLEGPFDVASARAVFSPDEWVSQARPWLGPRGVVCLHLKSQEPAPAGYEAVGRVDGKRWGVVGVRARSGVPRGTVAS